MLMFFFVMLRNVLLLFADQDLYHLRKFNFFIFHFIILQYNHNNKQQYIWAYNNLPTLAMYLSIKIIILVSILISSIQATPSLKCLTYLLQLKLLYETNKGLFFKEIAPFMLFSGKQLDDMGFPKMCTKNGMEYTTVKIDTYITDQHITEHPDFLFSFYYGFCFSHVCTADDMNEGGKFIIQNIFQDIPAKIESLEFIDANIDPNVRPISIILIALVLGWIFMTFVGPLSKWIGQCKQKKHQQVQISIPLQQPDKKQHVQQVQVYEQPIKKGFFKNISIGRRWMSLWKSENSTKIQQFSTFKICAVPLIVYAYYFYLCNKGSFNIFAFNSEIYDTFYSKVATFAYYLPDIFFFISGYLFTKHVFTQVEFAGNKTAFLLTVFGKRLLRLYPIYIVCLLIFWFILPSLHSGPVWRIFEIEIDRCDSVWWRNILMIDNFFSNGCFNFSWWVQAQIQYTVLALLTFAILFINKRVGSIILYIQLVASWILLYALSQKLPTELQVTISNSAQHYFKSFHSHVAFYLTGVVLALIFKKQSSRRLVINYYFKNTIILLLGIVIAITSFFLVLFRPVTFSYDSLSWQLALCRTGILYCFIIYCLPGLVKEKYKVTLKHKLAALTYPVILVSGIVVGASFWGLQTFPYTSGPNLLYKLFPNLFISFGVGVILHLLFNFKAPKRQEPHAI